MWQKTRGNDSGDCKSKGEENDSQLLETYYDGTITVYFFSCPEIPIPTKKKMSRL